MATDASAKKPSKTKSDEKSVPSLKSKSKQLLLSYVHVTKLQAERFLAPEDASKGVYTLEQKCGQLLAGKSPSQFGKFTYEMSLEGFALDAGEKQDPNKRSFSISIALEAGFNIVNGTISNAAEVNKLCPDVIGQVHALGAMRLIALAADLGFSGVRPRLSIRRELIPRFAPDGELTLEEE